MGAETFIDILDEATDGAQDGELGHGSRIGIVSFADTATKDTPLTATVSTLKQAVHALTSGGSTNHADAFTKALELFDPASANAKVMVLFTDGRTTAGGNASPIAAAAKAQGVVIYCIGLSGNGGIDEQALNDWSSDPDSAYVAITPDDEELENLFSDLAANITKPGATQIVIHDRVDACFKIISVDEPTKGAANQVDATSVQWKIDALGVKKSEGATLEFTVQHVGPCTGTIEVNDAITYSDREGNTVEFPSPEIEVECSVVDCSEHCPEPIEFPVDGCEDTVEFDAGEIGLDLLGRIVVLNVTLKDVCPHKRVALAIILSEVDQHGVEHRRGLKTLTIPAHTRATCKDVTVCGVKFVLPEDLDVSGSPDSICNRRKCRVRFIAHYIDRQRRVRVYLRSVYADLAVLGGAAEGALLPARYLWHIHVIDQHIEFCSGCLACMRNGGVCHHKDDMRVILEQILASDLLLFSFPLYGYGMPAMLKNLIGRTLPLSSIVS